MRQTIILLILAFSFVNNSNGQREYKFEYLDSLTQKFVSELKQDNIDTILVYRDDCITGESYIEVVFEDSCKLFWGYPPKAYCFWKKENKTFLKRIEYETCYDYFLVEYNIDSVWSFVFDNKEKLFSERIKPKMYIENSDTIQVGVDHYCFQELLIMDRKDTLVFELCNFYFEKLIDNKIESLSYNDNWATKRKKLQLILHEIVSAIDDKLLREKKYK